jgi:3-isopropylmalate/(R)-2-methylmalate dehydratase large subunit
VYDDVKVFEASEIRPTVTWGINPGQGIFIDEAIPSPEQLPEADRSSAKEALEFMKFKAGQKLAGQKIQVAFFGSCTNARVSDFVEASKFLKGRKVAKGIRAIAVPGSQGVSKICAEMGIDKIFREAGFDWREAGCSMCLGMNPDQLVGEEICASSSNRNFKGRQGSPTGRTLLMSPVMVAAAAVTGEVSDARKVFAQN